MVLPLTGSNAPGIYFTEVSPCRPIYRIIVLALLPSPSQSNRPTLRLETERDWTFYFLHILTAGPEDEILCHQWVKWP